MIFSSSGGSELGGCLQLCGRGGHAQGPHGAQPHEGRGTERAIVHPQIGPTRDRPGQQTTEYQAEPPVQEGDRHGQERNETHRAPRRLGHRGEALDQLGHRRGGGDDVSGQHHHGHLQGEGGQIPEAVAEGIHDRLRRGAVGQRGDGDEDDACQGDDIRVRKPPLRPTGQRLGDPRQPLLGASIFGGRRHSAVSLSSPRSSRRPVHPACWARRGVGRIGITGVGRVSRLSTRHNGELREPHLHSGQGYRSPA